MSKSKPSEEELVLQALDVKIAMENGETPEGEQPNFVKSADESSFLLQKYSCAACRLENKGRAMQIVEHLLSKKHYMAIYEFRAARWESGKDSEKKPWTFHFFNKPIVGLEYIAEIVNPTFPDKPNYRCLLCDKRTDKHGICLHLESQDHVIDYLKRFFPKTVIKLESYENESAGEKEKKLTVIVKLIEDKFGRMKPVITTNSNFAQHSSTIIKLIEEGPHFREDDCLGFHDLVDLELLIARYTDRCSSRIELSTPQAAPWQPLENPSLHNVNCFPPESYPPSTRETEKSHRERNRKIRRLKTYTDALKVEMAGKFKAYEKDPETHPFYEEEWQKFWSRRYREVMTEGKDPTKHDFPSEWVKFWAKRIKQLIEITTNERIKAFRELIGLPEEESEDRNRVSSSLPGEQELVSLPEEKSNKRSRVSSSSHREPTSRELDSLSEEKSEKRSRVSSSSSHREPTFRELFGLPEENSEERSRVSSFSHGEHTSSRVTEETREQTLAAVDKATIAQQLAATLVAHGRTDLSDSELEHMIGLVVANSQPS